MTLCECCCHFSWSTSWPLLYLVFSAWVHFDGFGTTRWIHLWSRNVVNFLHFILHTAQCSLLWDILKTFQALRGEHILPNIEFERFHKTTADTLPAMFRMTFSDYRRWCRPQLFQSELGYQLEQWWKKGETVSTLFNQVWANFCRI